MWIQAGTFKPYSYENHTLTVDFKTGSFREIYRDFKNASNDILVNHNGSVVIYETNYTQILFNDENSLFIDF